MVFPCLVLLVFAWLVSRHHTKLYAPYDYKADQSFIDVTSAPYRAAISLGAAIGKSGQGEVSVEAIEKVTLEAANSLPRSGVRRAARNRVVLWIDDRPANNVHERAALAAFGVSLVLSTSTEDALDRLEQERFGAIISDMGRPPDSRAGYTLLDAVRSRGLKTPFIIYAAGTRPEHITEARNRGALGTTNRPDELFRMVLQAIATEDISVQPLKA